MTERPNVQLVRSLYEAFARRDMSVIMTHFSPSIVIDQSLEIPWGGHYEGLEGALAFFQALTDHVTSQVTLERLIDAGDHVVALGRTRGVVNATEAHFDVPIAHVWTLQDGRATAVRYCIDNPTMLSAM